MIRPHPACTRPQLPSARVHQRAKPLIRHHTAFQLSLPLQIRRRAQHRRLEVDVDVLPTPLVDGVDFMIDADMAEVLDHSVPPLPGLAMRWAVGKPVNVLDAAPVADLDSLNRATVPA